MAKSREENRGFPHELLLGLGAATRHNALAYGYSLALTGAFGVLTEERGAPHAPDVLLFGLGGSITFAILNTVATRGYRVRAPEQPPIVRSLGSSIGFVSVTGAIAATWLFAWLVHGWAAWLVATFVASAVYLFLSAVELALADRVRAVLPADELEERG